MLDEIDKKILYSLDEDSTKSLTKISQEIGSTPQLVKYHLEKLEKDKIILAYWPMIEFRKMGYFNTSYFLKLKNLNHRTEREIIAYLKKNKDFNIVMRGDGYWDLHITISAQNIYRAVEIFNQFYDTFHDNILRFDTAISVGFYQFRRAYFYPRKRVNRDPMAFTGGDEAIVRLSSLQKKIISELNDNCRQSFSSLAKKLKVSRDKVVYNLKKIDQEKIIQSNTYLLNHDKIGFPRYRLLLQLTDFSSESYQKFFAYCQKHRNIVHLLRLFGNWQALIDVEIEDRKKLRRLKRKIMDEFSGFVLRIEITHAYKIDKFRDIPLA